MILDSEDLFGIGAEIGYDQDKIGDNPGGIEGYLIFRFKVDQSGEGFHVNWRTNGNTNGKSI